MGRDDRNPVRRTGGKGDIDLVADIVWGALDESRQSVQDLAAGSALIAARLRLERFIRAGSSRLDQSHDRPGWDWTRQSDPVGGLIPTRSYRFARAKGNRS